MRRKVSGYVFPLILMATISIGFFTLTLVQLQSSHHDQLQHLNDYQHALNLACSANVEVLSELREKQWDERFFKDKPIYKYDQELFGGIYDICVEDYDTAQYTFNVKIRTTMGDRKNLFYWRQKYMPNMLDFTRMAYTVSFGEFPPELFEPAKKSEIDKIVDDKLKNADNNYAESIDIAKNLKKEPTLGAVIKKLGALPPGTDPSSIKGESQLRPSSPVLGTQASNQPKVKASDVLDELKNLVNPVDRLNLPAAGRSICNSNLMIRSEPWGSVISTIPPGGAVDVIGLQGDFFEITRGGTSGYSHINWIAVPGHTPSGVEPPRPPGAPPAW